VKFSKYIPFIVAVLMFFIVRKLPFEIKCVLGVVLAVIALVLYHRILKSGKNGKK